MTSEPRSRNPNRQSSIYLGKDGSWHGRVTVGRKPDGSLDRRHVRATNRAAVTRKVRALEKLRDEARVPRSGGRSWTVEKWLEHWLEEIARPTIRHSSYMAYKTAVTKHLIPAIGGLRLDQLEPEHLEQIYYRMIRTGRKPGTAHQVHRTARTAFGEAERRGHIARNPAERARPPRVPQGLVEPFSVDEVQRLLDAAVGRRNPARWAIGLALGLRQGEVLALRWQDVDLEARRLRVRATRLRPIYEHGCGGSCGEAPGRCPQRAQLNDAVGETKSAAGNRVIGLPGELVELLRQHRRIQASDRLKAGAHWEEGDWVFTTRLGRPINPNSDYHTWRQLLKRSGVRPARLHDARHTAATVLLVLGVSERTVMSIMGWSSTSMAARYQHVTDSIRDEVADRVGGLLFGDGSSAGR